MHNWALSSVIETDAWGTLPDLMGVVKLSNFCTKVDPVQKFLFIRAFLEGGTFVKHRGIRVACCLLPISK